MGTFSHSNIIFFPVRQATEVEGMLREIYGESFVDSPNAALTLKRVKGEPRAMLGLAKGTCRVTPRQTHHRKDNQLLAAELRVQR